MVFIIGLCKDLKNVLNQTPVSTSSIVLSTFKNFPATYNILFTKNVLNQFPRKVFEDTFEDA